MQNAGKIEDEAEGTNERIAWAAGFFDGEGCVNLVRNSNRKSWYPELQVGNVHKQSLERFRDIVGTGKIYARKIVRDYRQMYVWVAAARQAEHALRLLTPYMITKRKQAELALQSRSCIGQEALAQLQAESLPELAKAIKKLNRGEA